MIEAGEEMVDEVVLNQDVFEVGSVAAVGQLSDVSEDALKDLF